MELLAIGADPIAISGTLSVEPKPTGDAVMEGIRREIKDANLSDLRITCSSEKNFRVRQTGVGITAIGVVVNSKLKVGRCEQGDEVVAVGKPCVGREVIQAEKDQRIADTLDVLKLRKNRFVHELIPAGSRGIIYEARVMAKDSGLSFDPSMVQLTNLEKSAGPATVIVAALREGSFSRVKNAIGRKPFRKVGTLLVGKKRATSRFVR